MDEIMCSQLSVYSVIIIEKKQFGFRILSKMSLLQFFVTFFFYPTQSQTPGITSKVIQYEIFINVCEKKNK